MSLMTLVHSVVAVLAAVALLMTLADDDGTYGIVVVLFCCRYRLANDLSLMTMVHGIVVVLS